jgi:hypothetical protein
MCTVAQKEYFVRNAALNDCTVLHFSQTKRLREHFEATTHVAHKGVQFKPKVQQGATCARYRPTVFFRHLALHALSLPHGKRGIRSKIYYLDFFTFLKNA